MAATLQCLTVVFAAVAEAACRTEARPATDTETESGGRSGAAAAWSDRAGTAGDCVWFSRLILRDVTKDGRPDSLHLVAIGQRPESLRVTFSVVSGGEIRYNASWRSEWYFIHDRPIDSIPAAQLSKRVNRLNEFFLPQDFGTLSPDDSSDAFDILPYEICGQPAGTPVAEGREPSCPDGLVRSGWRDIVALSPPTFRFFSGGEHSRIIAWSWQLQRFVVIFACC